MAQRVHSLDGPLTPNTSARRDRHASWRSEARPCPASCREEVGDVVFTCQFQESHLTPGDSTCNAPRPPAQHDGAHLGEAGDPSLGQEEPKRQVEVRARGPHQGRNGFTIDSELQGLFHDDGVNGAGSAAVRVTEAGDTVSAGRRDRHSLKIL